MMKFILPLLVALSTSLAVAQEKRVDPDKLKHPVKACLFKIEGNDLETPSYLFGTIHLGQKNVVTLHPNAQSAFEKSDAVYTEIDMDQKAQMALLPMLVRQDGKKLSEALGPDLTERLNEELQNINPMLKIDGFEPMKTWFAAISLPSLELQLKGQVPLDMVLYQKALKQGKTVDALETGKSQMTLFDQFTEEEMQLLLTDTLDQMKEDRENGTNSVKDLLNKYLTLDVYEIGEYVNQEMAEMKGNEDFKKRFLEALLDNRNVGMADKAHEFMQASKAESHFFAVGAAHYTGGKAVQDLLKKKGYTITEVFE